MADITLLNIFFIAEILSFLFLENRTIKLTSQNKLPPEINFIVLSLYVSCLVVIVPIDFSRMVLISPITELYSFCSAEFLLVLSRYNCVTLSNISIRLFILLNTRKFASIYGYRTNSITIIVKKQTKISLLFPCCDLKKLFNK